MVLNYKSDVTENARVCCWVSKVANPKNWTARAHPDPNESQVAPGPHGPMEWDPERPAARPENYSCPLRTLRKPWTNSSQTPAQGDMRIFKLNKHLEGQDTS